MHAVFIRVVVFLCLLAFTSQVLAAISASLDRNRIVAGETVTLVVQSDDPRQNLEPDLQVLAGDFEVIDKRTETKMSLINGRQTSSARLLLTLEPLRTGQLQVPPLDFPDGSSTAAIALQVDKAPELAEGEAPPVLLELELDPVEGPYYVHAQLALKVKIFYQQNLTEAAINAPEPAQASVRLLDEVPYQADRNGVRYRVLERHYALFPERSGEMVIPALQLTGRLIERPADRLWQPSVRGRRIRVESEPLSIEVLPKPAAFSGEQWLPARRIDLAQQITDGESIRVGEPVTRTIIVDAVGLEEHMLVEPRWPEVSNARIYPDQPQGISRDDGQWVLGHREFRYAVVPEQPGELLLPEIRLPWWDTVNNRERVAVLPEHRVRVLPSELAPATLPNALPGAGNGTAGTGAQGAGESPWWRLATIVLGLLWLATLALYWRSRGVENAGPGSASPLNSNEQATLMALRKACLSGDARTARAELAHWVRHFGPRAAGGSVLQFARQAGHPELEAAINTLDAVGFSDTAAPWDGRKLADAFDAWHKQAARRSRAPAANEFDLWGQKI
jgi:hypothetical protein